MEQHENGLKKNYKVNTRLILSLLIGLGVFSVILLATILTISEDTKFKKSSNPEKKQESEQVDPSETTKNAEILAVVKEIDTARKEITLYQVDKQETLVLTYTGGTNIVDKYEQTIAISHIQVGGMVEATYQQDNNKLIDLKISTKAWEYIGVSNLDINRSARTMKIATSKFKYTDDVLIRDGQDFISIDNLAEQDELTIRGSEETVWSITVTRGHGSVKLMDYELFIGANITIGYESMQQITKDMMITVREGNFNLTVENGRYSAAKNITIYRNEETLVSLSDLGPDAMKQSRVTFEITPFGADLFVDGELSSYANPIELDYGDHAVRVSLGGYTSYEGKLKVDAAGKIIKIDLPEAASEEEASVSETDTELATNNDIEYPSMDPGDADTTDSTDSEDSSKDEIVDKNHLIYIQKPSGASVYLNGDFMGISPGSFKKVIGTHVITFIKEDYETMSYTIDVINDGLDTYFTFPDLAQTD